MNIFSNIGNAVKKAAKDTGKAIAKGAKDVGKQTVRNAHTVGDAIDSKVGKILLAGAVAFVPGVNVLAATAIGATGGAIKKGGGIKAAATGAATGAAAGVAGKGVGVIAKAGFKAAFRTALNKVLPVGATPPVLRRNDVPETPEVVTPPLFEPVPLIDRSAETPAAYVVAGKVWAPGSRSHGMLLSRPTPAVNTPVALPPARQPKLLPATGKPMLNTNRDRTVREIAAAVTPIDIAPSAQAGTGNKWLPVLLLAGVVVLFVLFSRKK